MKCILSIDQGTTGTTACLIDATTFNFIGKVNKEYPQIYPQPGWVEHNLNDIWETVKYTTESVLKKFNIAPTDIVSIGITNQRETTCAFKKNGEPLGNAIVWQDRRTSNFCAKLKSEGYAEKIKLKTGLTIDPYFSATKMNWLLLNNLSVKKASDESDLCFGTIDTFLLYKFSGGKSFKTDASNASRTMLMDLEKCQWDSELLSLFQIKKECLPEICDSFSLFGKTSELSFLPNDIPITGILGDQQSALFGQAGFNKGDMKCTYGTGAFVLLNIGESLQFSESGLLTTVQYRHNGKAVYALEGSSYIAGAAVQWLRDNLKIINASSEVEPLARSVVDLNSALNILFMPFFTGIGSPHWRPEAKAAILGITRDTNNSHLALACLEGIALSINDLLSAMEKDTSLKIHSLKVDGGAVSNNYLMEIQASISNTKIIRPKVIETTAFGAALASAIGAGRLTFEAINDIWKKDCEFSPEIKLSGYLAKKKILWDEMVKKLYL